MALRVSGGWTSCSPRPRQRPAGGGATAVRGGGHFLQALGVAGAGLWLRGLWPGPGFKPRKLRASGWERGPFSGPCDLHVGSGRRVALALGSSSRCPGGLGQRAPCQTSLGPRCRGRPEACPCPARPPPALPRSPWASSSREPTPEAGGGVRAALAPESVPPASSCEDGPGRVCWPGCRGDKCW